MPNATTTKRIILKTTEQATSFLTERGVTVNEAGTCIIRKPGRYKQFTLSGEPNQRSYKKEMGAIEGARWLRTYENRRAKINAKHAARKAERDAEKVERRAKWAAEKAERAAKMQAELGNSKHVAKIGERVDVTATVRSVREFTYVSWGYNGCECTGQVVNFVTTDGDVVVWFNKGAKFEGTEGDAVKVRGTVKNHGEYQGVAQTTMQRVKVTAAA